MNLRCALVRQGAYNGGNALSLLYRRLFLSQPIPYVGVYTDGGTHDSLQRFGVDNLCAIVSQTLGHFAIHDFTQLALSNYKSAQLHKCRFSPNSWNIYRSKGAANINAIGLLLVCLSDSLGSNQFVWWRGNCVSRVHEPKTTSSCRLKQLQRSFYL